MREYEWAGVSALECLLHLQRRLELEGHAVIDRRTQGAVGVFLAHRAVDGLSGKLPGAIWSPSCVAANASRYRFWPIRAAARMWKPEAFRGASRSITWASSAARG